MAAGDLEVVHCDNHVLVVAKPAGVPTVPDSSRDTSLFDQARAWIRVEFDKPGEAFLAVVHRLDRPVSGCVVFGRTSKGAARLSEAFRAGRALKEYWAVTGEARGEVSGHVEQWLLKDRDKNRVHVVAPGTAGAKRALTERRVLERRAGRVLWDLRPRTGRSHQLRVAMASAGVPLLGDLRYGAHQPLSDKSVALHAVRLELDHPTRGERLTFTVPPPKLAVWDFDHCRRGDGDRA